MTKQMRMIITLTIVLLVVIQIPIYILYQEGKQELLLAIFLLALIFIALRFGIIAGLYSSLVFLFIIGSAIFYIQLTNNSSIFVPLDLKMSVFFMYGISIIVLVIIAGRINELLRDIAKETAELKEKVSKYVAIDLNSGFDNRYRLEKDIVSEIKRANRSEKSYVFLLLQIQHINNFEKLYGENETANLIKGLAKNINRVMRLTDKKYRFDKEHFALILPETTNEYIHVIYEKLSNNMKEHELLNGNLVTLSFKAGHYIYQPNSDVHFDEIIEVTKNETMINEI